MRWRNRIKADIDRLEIRIIKDRESFNSGLAEQRQLVEDSMEHLALEQYPDTIRCEQCKGTGEKVEAQWTAGRYSSFEAPAPAWRWTCVACKGSGRIPTEKKSEVEDG